MTRVRRTAPLLAALAALAVGAAPAAAVGTKTATFEAGSANYLQGGTSGPFNATLGGTATFTDAGANALTATVDLTGLAPSTRYVVVAYKDGECLPTPGLTAFPSGALTTDAAGAVHATVGVNPTAINPLGQLKASQINSVSVRAVVINGVALPFTVPNSPFPATPTVPNVAYVEGCDTSPS